jgi:hypothetical protein
LHRASPPLVKIGEGMIGHGNWPLKHKHAEEGLVRRFAARSVTHGLSSRAQTPYDR